MSRSSYVASADRSSPPISLRIRELLTAMRPQQWVKNIIVFAPPLFALRTDPHSYVSSGGAFVAFAACSSATYLFNDIQDAESDRAHPRKRLRPIASGRVTPLTAALFGVVLLAAGLALATVITLGLLAAVGAFVAIQVAYNVRLRREPIADITCIASGFVIRAIGGGVATGVPVSTWFLLCVGLLAFYLAIEKRKAELTLHVETAAISRAVLNEYSPRWLDRMESVVTASALMSYSLWAIERARTPWMLVTVPLVAYALFRYQFLAEQGRGEAPERALVGSVHMVVAITVWGITAIAILYLQAHGFRPFAPYSAGLPS